MPFTFHELEIDGVVLVEPKVYKDERGYFLETYKMPDFVKAGITRPFVQDNYSRSCRGVLRGLHYQKSPFAQGKMVSVIQGKIFDVAVDIRKDSPTFGRWVSATLSAGNKNMLYVPQGFAHGFLILSAVAKVLYKATNVYSPEAEAGIIWNDRDLKIDWPVKEPILAERDKKWPALNEVETGF